MPDSSLHTADAPRHSGFSRILHDGQPLALRVRYGGNDYGSSGEYVSDTFGRTDALLCVLQLHDFPAANGWREGRHFRHPVLQRDSFVMLDLRETWQTEVAAPFDNIHLNITRQILAETAETCGGAPDLDFESFVPFEDETLRHLALSVMPALRRPTEISALFVAHLASAAALHLLEKYGTRGARFRGAGGGLAPWQARRARDLIREHLDADIDLKTLAASCGLSPAHFAKAFKRTMGVPPHRWLLRQRVERAQEMLLAGREPLNAIALACGFADQSHMTRVFSRAVGMPPGAWRRAVRR